MRRRIITITTLVMLIVSVISVNVLASKDTSTSYDTTTRQYIGSVTNDNGAIYAYGKLTPSHGVARLQICNWNGTIVRAYGVYPTYPQNTSKTRYSISSGETVTFYVKPEISGEYVWGGAKYGLEP